MQRGYIKIWRKTSDDPIMSDLRLFGFFVELIMMANHKPAKIICNQQEMLIDRGQFITGRRKLSSTVHLTEQTVRTYLKTLKSTHKLTIKTYSKFSLITIINYEKYQATNQQTNQQLTSNQPASNQQLTTNNNDKNEKNDKRGPALAEVKTFWEAEALKGDPHTFYDFYAAVGWIVGGKAPMKDWRAAARNWSRREPNFKRSCPPAIEGSYVPDAEATRKLMAEL